MFRQASRLDNVPVSASAALTQMAREITQGGGNVIPLSLGEPDFDTPAHVVEAAHAAALRGETRYPPQPGTPALKSAIRAKFLRDNNLDYALDEIMVANGGTQIIFDAFMASVNPGDEVLVPAPYWISYANMVKFAAGVPVAVPCHEENRFKLRVADIEAAITPRTKWLVLNFPNNPTGAACTRAEMREIADLLLRHPRIMVLTDDMYEHILYDGAEFCTIAQVEPALRDRVLTVNGVSKTYAMTGWRVGFCGGPKPLLAAMLNVQGQTTSGICSVAQAAAAAALDGPQDYLALRRDSYRARRDLVMGLLAETPGLRCHRPEGAFYAFPSMQAHLGKRSKGGTPIENGQDFVLALLREKHVATVYGAAYGMEGYFRISYAASPAQLTEGCRRISEFCHELC
ncbi:MAG: pyridoxal phosphate-dependent aminotransferase [Paracoccus sp. (in: a-proteobacteria)]|uniref:pyridoxal phosphate-dependent aminotransferase n=1 Tax=Paracoccus sp. TaxID=267 RepID=UPI0039E50E7F